MFSRTWALGGWTRPWLAAGVVVIIPAIVAAWILAGPIRERTAVVTAVLVVGVVGLPFAVMGATPSTAQLVKITNSMRFPGDVQRDVRVGSGRCRPACSELRRTLLVSGVGFAKARSGVMTSLRYRKFEIKEYGRVAGAPLRIDAQRNKIKISIELREVDLDNTRIALIVLVDGPAPDYEVG